MNDTMKKRLPLGAEVLGGFMIFLSTFLPFLSVEFLGYKDSVSLMSAHVGDGILLMLIGAALIAGAIVPMFVKLHNNVIKYVEAVIAVIAFIMMLVISIGTKNNLAAASYLSSYVKFSAGFWFLLLGTIIAIAGAGFDAVIEYKTNGLPKSSKPQQAPYVQQPQAGQYMGQPQQAPYAQQPQAGQYMGQPQQAPYAQQPQAGQYMGQPQQQAPYVQQPQQPAYTQPNQQNPNQQ